MRILAIIILLAFGGGAYLLSRYVENSLDEKRKYGSDDLVRAIRIHNHLNKTPTSSYQELPPQRSRQVIQYGGGVQSYDPEATSTTYFNNDIPTTNEGQPGQPLPLTGQAPSIPVYK